jgi:tetratricopeptide (TPR) repeat protein
VSAHAAPPGRPSDGARAVDNAGGDASLRLAKELELREGHWVAFVFVDSRRTAREVLEGAREAVDDGEHVLELTASTPYELELFGDVADFDDAASRRLVWIDATAWVDVAWRPSAPWPGAVRGAAGEGSSDDWRDAWVALLQRLNERREAMRRSLAGAVVVAAPRAWKVGAAQTAADLWSQAFVMDAVLVAPRVAFDPDRSGSWAAVTSTGDLGSEPTHEPDGASARSALAAALVFLRAEQLDEATRALDAAVRLVAEGRAAKIWAARAWLMRGRLYAAQASDARREPAADASYCFRRAADEAQALLSPASPGSRASLATSVEALDVWSDALTREGTMLVRLGVVDEGLERLARAEARVEGALFDEPSLTTLELRALEIKLALGDARAQRGQLFDARGAYYDALQHAERARPDVETLLASSRVHERLGRVREADGHPEIAARDYLCAAELVRRARALLPGDAPALDERLQRLRRAVADAFAKPPERTPPPLGPDDDKEDTLDGESSVSLTPPPVEVHEPRTRAGEP